jgi:hypothetical protein
MVKCGVLFEVRTEFLNNIYTSFVFNGLMKRQQSNNNKWSNLIIVLILNKAVITLYY